MTSYPLMLAALLLAPQDTGAPGARNPCVTCHEGLPAPAAAAHSFADWRASAHAGAVTCDRCHDGDTTATDQQAAHRYVYPSKDRRSKVYARQVPATCGTCHQQELGYFMESQHYAVLQTSERGPSCVTCHGSMAIHILAPEELDAACSPCHAAAAGAAPELLPTARRLLGLVRQTDSLVGAVQSRLEQAADQRRRDAATRQLRLAQDAMQRSRQGWHAFNLAMMDSALTQGARFARRADSVLTARPRR
jgi:hypothetical protein